MAGSKKTVGFWIGQGVLGKGIKYGEPILEGSIDPKTITAQRRLGNIQDSEVSDKAAENIQVAETLLKEAKTEIEDLKKFVKTLKAEVSAKDKEIESLKSESEESLKAEIKTLKAENKKLEKAAK